MDGVPFQDPRTPETEAWLAELERDDPRAHAVALVAMSYTFRGLARDAEWNERIRVAFEKLAPTKEELDAIAVDAVQAVQRMGKSGGSRPARSKR